MTKLRDRRLPPSLTQPPSLFCLCSNPSHLAHLIQPSTLLVEAAREVDGTALVVDIKGAGFVAANDAVLDLPVGPGVRVPGS